MKPTLVLNGQFPRVNLEELDAIPGVRCVAVWLTVSTAQRLLERNVHNRKFSENVVQKYVMEIKAGEWRLTPAGIGFNDKGELVDGQHRLHAIVRAKTAVPMLITLGLPSSSQEKVDRQRRRTLFDALYLAGLAISRQEVEIAACLTRRFVRSESGVVPSDFLVKQTLECHIEHIRAVIAAMKGANKNTRGLSQASFLSAAVLYHEIDAVKSLEFLEGVRTGTMLTEDHPAMRLRRFLLGETTVKSLPRGGANQSFIFRRAVFAMQAHLEGRNISGLREAEDFQVKKQPLAANEVRSLARGQQPSLMSQLLSEELLQADEMIDLKAH
ncbi:hypothetical protein [Prosthecobacter sp.]|uniref:hypothetical protein n=1 Tax=Prosthecobacter sp. TaxID=1965333 RepID=UPI0037832122